MTDLPDRIWLQWFGDSDEPPKDPFWGDVTWCQDKINDNDVEYIRKGAVEGDNVLLHAQVRELRELLAETVMPLRWEDLGDYLAWQVRRDRILAATEDER